MEKCKRIDEGLIASIYNELRNNHAGRKNAVKRSVFAADHGLSEREMRFITHEINGNPEYQGMLSTSTALYFCDSKEECIKAIGVTYRSAFTLLRKARRMEKKLREDGQVVLTENDFKTLRAYFFDRDSENGKVVNND